MKLLMKLPTTRKLTAVAGFVAVVAAAAAVDKFFGTSLLPWVLTFGGG
ncbi:hypothetical protein [Azospirillum argentinense]